MIGINVQSVALTGERIWATKTSHVHGGIERDWSQPLHRLPGANELPLHKAKPALLAIELLIRH